MRPSKKPLVGIFLGRSGSGKGTQVKLLKKKLGLDYISSGKLLRRRKKIKDFTGKKLQKVLDRGGLVPTPVVFKLWLDRFEKLKKKKNFKGFIYEGSPRKIFEAYLMDEALGWYEWNKKLKVILIDISEKEAIARLTKRGREDDKISAIKSRLSWFQTNVVPVINFYRKTGRLIKINGEQTVENVFKDILKALGR
ncbi:MAG: adenylate kinase [Parcubacteria group bacterium Gr01-1014_30]|nr:MAG: adenylate kinase [Parcubacteria group bacterium Gr01-1014_30]